MTWNEGINTFNTTLSVPSNQIFTYDPTIDKADPGVILEGTESNAVYSVIREVGGNLFFVQNADYNGTSWIPQNLAAPVYALQLDLGGGMSRLTCAAGITPVTWTTEFVVDNSGNITDVLGSRRAQSAVLANCDGSTTTVTYATPFNTQTTLGPFISVHNNFSLNSFELGAPQVLSTSALGFQIVIPGGSNGSTCTIDYIAYGV